MCVTAEEIDRGILMVFVEPTQLIKENLVSVSYNVSCVLLLLQFL